MMKFFVLTVLAASAFGGPTLSIRQNGTCDKGKVTQLVGGIQANLFIQQQELAGCADVPAVMTSLDLIIPSIQCLQKLEPNQASSQFAEERQKVLAIQQLGIDIRAQNQNLAKEINSPATDGLNIVEGAQITEMQQVMGLTGDGEKDKAVLETLVKEVEDGTKQNKANLAAAQGKCKSE